jgi:uncharacterized metal-binding protein YceD (DUF177 family)
MPLSQQGEECAECQDHRLFIQVRDYIRTNDVSETKLAEKFGISQRKIQKWIREDKIQVAGGNCEQSVYGHCARCGDPLEFGNYCATCLRLIKREKQNASQADWNNLKMFS